MVAVGVCLLFLRKEHHLPQLGFPKGGRVLAMYHREPSRVCKREQVLAVGRARPEHKGEDRQVVGKRIQSPHRNRSEGWHIAGAEDPEFTHAGVSSANLHVADDFSVRTADIERCTHSVCYVSLGRTKLLHVYNNAHVFTW